MIHPKDRIYFGTGDDLLSCEEVKSGIPFLYVLGLNFENSDYVVSQLKYINQKWTPLHCDIIQDHRLEESVRDLICITEKYSIVIIKIEYYEKTSKFYRHDFIQLFNPMNMTSIRI